MSVAFTLLTASLGMRRECVGLWILITVLINLSAWGLGGNTETLPIKLGETHKTNKQQQENINWTTLFFASFIIQQRLRLSYSDIIFRHIYSTTKVEIVFTSRTIIDMSLGTNIHTQVLSTGGNFSWVEYIPSSVVPRGVVRYCKRIYVPKLESIWWLAIGQVYITRGSKDFGKDTFPW